MDALVVKGFPMRKVIFLGLIAIAGLLTGCCHPGHASFNYGYSSAPDCGPRYHYVEHHHGYGHAGHRYGDRYCD